MSDIIDLSLVAQRTAYMPNWDVELTIIKTDHYDYFVLRQLCAVLGIADVGAQSTRLKEHTTLSKFVATLPVQTTTRGRQAMLCLQKRGLAWWLASLNPMRVRAEVRNQLIEFQEEAIDALDRVLFGENESIDTQGAILMLEQRVGRIEAHINLSESDDD